MNQFPASFLWGASSSAFQIEGGWDEGGKGMTVADFNSFKLSDKQADTKVASDFYHHWKEDIDLMKELGLYDLTPALCRLDYTMSEAGGVTNFVRQYTLASGGPYCDCGYKKKG